MRSVRLVNNHAGETERPEQIKRMLKELFRELSPALKGYKVFLFGSRATRTASPRSDFDVGVYGDKPMALHVFYRIEDRLDALATLYAIDWVDFNRVDPGFRERALKNIEILYE